MKELNCKTLEIKNLTQQIHRVRLQAIEGELFSFKGGQYLYLLMPDGKRIPLSIASAPEQKEYIELHIRLIPGHELAANMLQLFKTANKIHIEGPYGQCFLRKSDNDVVVIAGGTGFSPVKSMIESAFAQNTKRHFSLYLGAQNSNELYQTELVNNWGFGKNQFNYLPVIAEKEEHWSGAIGFPHEIALLDSAENINKTDFYISGSEVMVMNVYRSLVEAGASKDNIYSDILDIKREMGEEL
jgi:CDP-4-dehydro-6-deoxyglucose reductase, E3